MLDTAIPSIFDGVESIPNTKTLGVIDNEQEPITLSCTEKNPITFSCTEQESITFSCTEQEPITLSCTEQEPITLSCIEEHIKTSNSLNIDGNAIDVAVFTDDEFPSVKIQSPNAEDVIWKFVVINDFEIQVLSKNESHTVNVPKPWTIVRPFTDNNCQLIFSQIITRKNNDKTPVIEKSIVIDSERSVRYYVHGQLVKQQQFNFPQTLNDPKVLVTVAIEFASACICDGLGDVDIHLANFASICKDNMDMYRSTNCSLLGKEKRCNFCVRLRKTLAQKKSRCEKRQKCKRLTCLSNPLDQKKMDGLRKKLEIKRRSQNRKTIRIRVLSESLRQKQDELLP